MDFFLNFIQFYLHQNYIILNHPNPHNLRFLFAHGGFKYLPIKWVLQFQIFQARIAQQLWFQLFPKNLFLFLRTQYNDAVLPKISIWHLGIIIDLMLFEALRVAKYFFRIFLVTFLKIPQNLRNSRGPIIWGETFGIFRRKILYSQFRLVFCWTELYTTFQSTDRCTSRIG